MKTRITELFGIQYPIIQGGMIWASGWRLAAAVSNAGGLGLLGAGSMHPETLTEHIRKCKAATDKPFGVNIPIMYPEMDKAIEVILREGVKVVFTSAGNPATYTSLLQKEGIKVAHVVSSSKFALKAQAAGVDAVVAEGFEAGGDKWCEKTTTMALLPSVRGLAARARASSRRYRGSASTTARPPAPISQRATASSLDSASKPGESAVSMHQVSHDSPSVTPSA